MRLDRGPTIRIAAVLLVCLLASPAYGAGPGLDPSFGTGGRVVTTFPDDAWGSGVVATTGGEVIATGDTSGSFALAGYDTTGTLDPGFGTGGTTTLGEAPFWIESYGGVTAQDDGKVLVVGAADRQRFAVARFEADGDPDPTFGGGDGILTVNLSPGTDIAYGVAVQANGRIVVVGSAGSARPDFAVVRLLPDGTPDHAFGKDGIVLEPFGLWGMATDIAVQPNGRLVVGGFNGRGFALARFRGDGSLDPRFGHGGKVGNTVPLGFARDVTLLPDGRILLAGDLDIFRLAIARYTPRGQIDLTFGDDGLVHARIGSGEQAIQGLAPQSGGRLIAAATIGPHEYGDTTMPRQVLLRFGPNGARDETFAGTGKIVTRFPDGLAGGGVDVQDDGKILMIGSTSELGTLAFVLTRYIV